MLYIVTTFYAKGHATERIAANEAESYAYTPLIASAFVLEAGPLLTIGLAVRALEKH